MLLSNDSNCERFVIFIVDMSARTRFDDGDSDGVTVNSIGGSINFHLYCAQATSDPHDGKYSC
jgi:hypothetical protein